MLTYLFLLNYIENIKTAEKQVQIGTWKLDYLEALMQFVTGAMQSFAPEEHLLIITRDKSILGQVLKNPSFNLQRPLNIQFQSSGVSELGVDADGPTRGFFHYLMEELVTGSFSGIKLFEGEAGHLIPSFDYDLISSCFFVFVGKMTVHSFIH